MCAMPSHSCNAVCSSMISGSDNSARCCFSTLSARRAAATLACLLNKPPAPNFASSSFDIVARSMASFMDANNTVVAEESAVSSASLRRRALRSPNSKCKFEGCGGASAGGGWQPSSGGGGWALPPGGGFAREPQAELPHAAAPEEAFPAESLALAASGVGSPKCGAAGVKIRGSTVILF